MKIITFDGSLAERANCRRIKGEYYEMNNQCFKMPDGKWHRINNGLIVFNNTTGKYVMKSDIDKINLISGIVGVDESGNIIEGYFEKDILSNVAIVCADNKKQCISEEIASKIGRERLSDGMFYTNDILKRLYSGDVDNFFNRKGIDKSFTFDVEYGSSNKLKEFLKTSDQFKFDADKYPFSKYLGSTTFGIEFETKNGYIPERHLYRTGLIPCRDGSISGWEYVTVPMSGAKGLAMIDEHTKLLQKYTDIDHRCSMHIHFGNYELSKEYVVSVYRIIYHLQDEIFKLFPEYYKHTSLFKRRDYNNPLPNLSFSQCENIDYNFNLIYNYLLGVNHEDADEYPFEGFLESEHPLDNRGNAKWHIPTRYHLYNLVPMIWGNRGTIEARIHTPTQNKIKIGAWLFINKAILEFAFNNKKCISDFSMNLNDITLSKVISESYDNQDLVDYLLGYVKIRKYEMYKQSKIDRMYGGHDGRTGKNEVNDDLKFNYSTNKIKSLI